MSSKNLPSEKFHVSRDMGTMYGVCLCRFLQFAHMRILEESNSEEEVEDDPEVEDEVDDDPDTNAFASNGLTAMLMRPSACKMHLSCS